MNLVRGQNYTTAGFVGSEQEKFNLLSSAYVLDGTAGRGYDTYDGRQDVRHYSRTRRRSFGVSMKRAAALVGCLVAVIAVVLVINAIRIRRLAYEVSILENQVVALAESNLKLDKSLVQARDTTRINQEAVTRLYMVPVEEATVYEVEMPDTRPFSPKE